MGSLLSRQQRDVSRERARQTDRAAMFGVYAARRRPQHDDAFPAARSLRSASRAVAVGCGKSRASVNV